jgi:hypothetical protein
MGGKAGSRPLRHMLRVAFVGGVAFVGACLPQSGNDEDSGKQSLMSFAGTGGVPSTKTDKADPLGQVTSAARDLFGGTDAQQTTRQDRVQTAARDERAVNVAPGSSLPPQPLPEIDDISASVALGSFFKALGALESGRVSDAVTILHLGDSHIAADRFSGDMREQFQSRFGNAGRGMVMPGLYMTRGVKFDQGGDWVAALSTGGSPGPYGLTGVKVSASRRDDWLRLTTTDRPFGWAEVTLQTGPGQGSAIVATDGEGKQAPLASAAQGWKTVRLDRQARELIIRPKGDGPITVHSIVTGEDRAGVRYVSLGLPGATAMTPLAWSATQLTQELNQIAPGLIVIGYGTEESFEDELNMRDYESRVMAVLSTLRQMAPQASLLVIGPPDVARLPKFAGAGARSSDVCRALSPQERATYGQRLRAGDQRLSRWHPPLRLDEVRYALRRAAAANKAYFWDWSKIMGGSCGIHAWVHSDPPLAAGDHVHLTEEGSKRSARLLFRELMNGYDSYDRALATGQGGWKPAVSEAPTIAPAAAAQKAKGKPARQVQ